MTVYNMVELVAKISFDNVTCMSLLDMQAVIGILLLDTRCDL